MTESSDQAERVLAEMTKDADAPTVVDPHPDRSREMKTPGFSRMRTDWNGPDREVVQNIQGIIENRILMNFADAYALMNEVYDVVREPAVDEHGEIQRDRFGFMLWARSQNGAPIEDFTKMTVKQREDFLFKITTRIFEWEQRAAEAWTEAMLAKAQWEEAFAVSFDSPPGRLTVEDRTQKGRLGSRDERYFAVFLSAYSRRADALVRSMTLLGQRLKDSLG